MSGTGSVIAQFETQEGERTGPQLDVPLGTTPAELAVIVNELLRNDESVPYAFYVAEEEVSSSLAAAIGGASTEQAVRVVYVPQAVFRVRAVTRCTSTLPGHASPIVSAQFAPGGKLLATGAGDHTVYALVSSVVTLRSRYVASSRGSANSRADARESGHASSSGAST